MTSPSRPGAVPNPVGWRVHEGDRFEPFALQVDWLQAWKNANKHSLIYAPRRSGKTTALALSATSVPEGTQLVVAHCRAPEPEAHRSTRNEFVNACRRWGFVLPNDLPRYPIYADGDVIDWSVPTLLLIDDFEAMSPEWYKELVKPALESPTTRLVGLGLASGDSKERWFGVLNANPDATSKDIEEASARAAARDAEALRADLLVKIAVGESSRRQLSEIERLADRDRMT